MGGCARLAGQPPGEAFTFVSGVQASVERAWRRRTHLGGDDRALAAAGGNISRAVSGGALFKAGARLSYRLEGAYASGYLPPNEKR